MAAKSKIINEDLTKNKLKKFNLYSYYYVRSPLTTIDILTKNHLAYFTKV